MGGRYLSGVRDPARIFQQIFFGVIQYKEIFETLVIPFFLAETFDAIIPSCDVSVRKPDKRIYEIALEKVGSGVEIPPCRAVYVDNEDGDLATPEKMGMETIKYPADPSNETARKTAMMIERLYQCGPEVE